KIWSFYRVVVKNDDGNNARLF
ncbi:transposase, partial [Shigella flexneri]|nr:transposase [Shigella flexneri]EFY0548516.1 transposase [Shigella flexneri]EFY0762862.1 transposase [Shigella flexneri]EFY1161891.1 transposase [Shigella flexneri]EFY2464336.1 transposase [Shigella flexneri]